MTGPTELVPWSKKVDGKPQKMPPYTLLHAIRIEGPEVIIPAPPDGPLQPIDDDAAAEAYREAMRDAENAELDAIAENLPDGPA